MLDRRQSKHLLAAGGIVLASWGVGSIANGAQVPQMNGFEITSTTFKDGAMMPDRTTFTGGTTNPWCAGQNISPQLSWTKAPAGTKSFAITMVTAEPDDINMVVYGIPANVTSLAEGELSKPSDKFVGGKNKFGIGTWRGPCNPPRASAHHYAIRILATDLDPKELPPGLTLAELQAKVRGHTKETAAIVGLSVKP